MEVCTILENTDEKPLAFYKFLKYANIKKSKDRVINIKRKLKTVILFAVFA